MSRRRIISSQSGAVALFVVIFTAILLVLVTLSFVQLMVKDQQQATNNDLSQSAYDSAQAGVQDGERLLLANQACQNNTSNLSAAQCVAIAGAISSGNCNTLAVGLYGAPTTSQTETLLQSSLGSVNLDQAYTCVKISTSTNDYLGELQLNLNQTELIPLSTGGTSVASIKLNWFSSADMTGGSPSVTLPPDTTLPRVGAGAWSSGNSTPPIIEAQLIQPGASFKLSDFDSSKSRTLFLYPSATGANKLSFNLDGRRAGINTPSPVTCQSNLAQAGGGYSCSVTLTPSAAISGNPDANFLRLSTFYNGAHFQVQLFDSSNKPVLFDGVQPDIDATGRANDLFRRISARVVLTGQPVYPHAELSLTGNLCKDFTVTNKAADYVSNCTP